MTREEAEQALDWFRNRSKTVTMPGAKRMYLLAIEALKAQIDKDINVPSNDCISRQAAIDALYHVDEYNGRSIEAIRNLPSAQQKIIHCAGCNHRNKYRFPPRYDERDYCEIHEKTVQLDWYCSWAERRQDE